MKKLFISLLILSLLLNLLLTYKSRILIINKINSYLFTEKSKDNTIEWSTKSYNKPFLQDDNNPLATYSVFNKVDYLASYTSDIEYNLLPDSLFIPKGKYNFYGNNYNLTKGGVYRFIYPGVDNEQRIVYNGNIDTLLSSISWIVTHGNSDAGLNNEQLLQKATDSKLFITCGTISILADRILGNFGIKSRLIIGMTKDKWNNYDNGHSLIEVFREKYNKWVLYDLDNNCFLTKNSEPLSFVELCDIINNNQEYQIAKLSEDTRLAVNSFHDKEGYEYDFYSESLIATDNSLKKWYSRVLQIPLIKEGKYYFYDNDSVTTERMVKYSSNYASIGTCEKFIDQFYSENYNLEKLRLTICKKH
mgnify:CR=1 FL=1